MRIHRFIDESLNLTSMNGAEVDLVNKDIVHQIIDVLKLVAKERVTICDGRGLETTAEILRLNRGAVTVRCGAIQTSQSENAREITLYCAVLKKENFETAIQKATEVGVSKIIPLITDRTVKMNINIARLKKIAREAAEQSGRSIVPQMDEPIKFESAVSEAKQNDLNLFFAPGGRDIEKEKISSCDRVGVFVGPEGGWTESEHYLAEANGFFIANLGRFVLRAETAATVAAYLAVNS